MVTSVVLLRFLRLKEGVYLGRDSPDLQHVDDSSAVTHESWLIAGKFRGCPLMVVPEPARLLGFGPHVATQVNGVMNVGQGMLPLADDGTFTLFTGTASLSITNATFDFDVVQLSMSSSAN